MPNNNPSLVAAMDKLWQLKKTIEKNEIEVKNLSKELEKLEKQTSTSQEDQKKIIDLTEKIKILNDINNTNIEQIKQDIDAVVKTYGEDLFQEELAKKEGSENIGDDNIKKIKDFFTSNESKELREKIINTLIESKGQKQNWTDLLKKTALDLVKKQGEKVLSDYASKGRAVSDFWKTVRPLLDTKLEQAPKLTNSNNSQTLEKRRFMHFYTLISLTVQTQNQGKTEIGEVFVQWRGDRRIYTDEVIKSLNHFKKRELKDVTKDQISIIPLLHTEVTKVAGFNKFKVGIASGDEIDPDYEQNQNFAIVLGSPATTLNQVRNKLLGMTVSISNRKGPIISVKKIKS